MRAMSIEIHFKKGGGMTVKPTGYPGQTCHEATRPYVENMLEPKLVQAAEETVTEAAPVQQQHRQQLGNS